MPATVTGMPPRRVLVVVTQRIGDVLLATPLIRSLSLAWPGAEIDVLVFDGTGAVLQGNPDVHRIVTVPPRSRWHVQARLLMRLWRRYDIALSTQTGDRPTLYAWAAGRRRVGLRPLRPKEQWKCRLMHRVVPYDPVNQHTVLTNLGLAQALGAEPRAEVVAAWTRNDAVGAAKWLGQVTRPRFAVIHPCPKFNYKQWTLDGWVVLGRWLDAQGVQVVLSGSRDEDETAYLDQLRPHLPVGTVDIAGSATLGELAFLLKRASLYVGPDTAVTHLAAATGVPTIALFGPSNPVRWGPWPSDRRALSNPYQMTGCQQSGNVFLIQGPGHCVPCHEEGCQRHLRSTSECLQGLPHEVVIEAAAVALSGHGRGDQT